MGARLVMLLLLSPVAGCTLEPLELAPPGRPLAVPAPADAMEEGGARVIVSVPRSPDETSDGGLVSSYVLLRRTVEGDGELAPFHYTTMDVGAASDELVYFDVSGLPGRSYQYVAFALAERERMTFGNVGARAARSEPSASVTVEGRLSPSRAVAPPAAVDATPDPRRTGFQVRLDWARSPDDGGDGLVRYEALRAEPGGELAPFPGGLESPEEGDDGTLHKLLDVPGDAQVRYVVYAVPRTGDAAAAPAASVTPARSFFDARRLPILVVLLMTVVLGLVFLARAQRAGESIFIRRIPGVDAIEEAIGRATEMGRPVLYVPGIDEIQNIQTIASMLILGRVAETIARYDTELLVPCRIPLVATVSEEVVRQGFYDAGRPDAHKPRNVQWISSEQFAYCAGTNGIILREKPATNLYLGRFFAESLLLGETGYVNRAIQIAGTAAIAQLPFFIASCDYTLIGEELYAVGAYMTREPNLLSSLKAADWVKALCILTLLVGTVAAIFAPESSFTVFLVESLSGA